jgi:hypothetical protein
MVSEIGGELVPKTDKVTEKELFGRVGFGNAPEKALMIAVPALGQDSMQEAIGYGSRMEGEGWSGMAIGYQLPWEGELDDKERHVGRLMELVGEFDRAEEILITGRSLGGRVAVDLAAQIKSQYPE